MIPLQTLQTQHDELKDLCQVLSILTKHEELCNTKLCQELFARLGERLRDHLAMEDQTLYPELIRHADKNMRTTAERFLSGSYELRKLFNEFNKQLKKWYRDKTTQDHGSLSRDSQTILRLLMERMQVEELEFMPMAAKFNDRNEGHVIR